MPSGVRTFPLIGLLSYALALLSAPQLTPWVIWFAVIGGFMFLSYHHNLGGEAPAGLATVGLGTRLVSLPLALTMVVAILTAKRADITGLTALVGFEEWGYLVFFLWLAVAGAGPLSLDGLVARLRGSREASLPEPLLRPRR